MLGMGANQQLPTVLIIDDDMVSREVMATVLTMSGYTIHTAAQGEEAIALLDSGTCKPEVVLMDTQMPGLRGRALVDALRTRSNASIYAMSGSDVPEDVRRAVDGHLSKPFGPHALQQLMEQHHVPQVVVDEPEAPVVKAESLAQLRGMMPESAVREIFDAVVTDLERRQAALRKALAIGDMAEIRRIGHAIKGGCGLAGAMQAMRIGARLEAIGDYPGNGSALLGELETARLNLKRMLEAEFLLP
jgi:CheY-like chemotaxis protein